MCKKLLVLTKSCWSRTDGPALVVNTAPCPGILIDRDVLVILLSVTLSFWNRYCIGCHNHRSFNRKNYRKKTYVILVSFIKLLKKLSVYNNVLDTWKRWYWRHFSMSILQYISVTTYCPGTDCYIVAVFDFNSSPIANAMTKASGLWDLKTL